MKLLRANTTAIAAKLASAFHALANHSLGCAFGTGLSLGCTAPVGAAGAQECAGNSLPPIVYRDEYNIRFFGLEKLHPFDSKKWGKVFNRLKKNAVIKSAGVHAPEIVPGSVIEEYLDGKYLKRLSLSREVASIMETSFLFLIPNGLLRRFLFKPMKFQVGGTILAAKLALQHGWAINIGGGYHHASCHDGSGFCIYPDIYIAVQEARKERPGLRVLIVDMDAHQGNGHEMDFMEDEQTKILDMYNTDIYPYYTEPHRSKERINFEFKVRSGTETAEYLDKTREALDTAIRQAGHGAYDLVVYNAGTDILEGDHLGCLKVSPSGVVQRDELVFRAAIENGIPILMVTSGGYLPSSYVVIADSITNLDQKGLLHAAQQFEPVQAVQCSSAKPAGPAGGAPLS